MTVLMVKGYAFVTVDATGQVTSVVWNLDRGRVWVPMDLKGVVTRRWSWGPIVLLQVRLKIPWTVVPVRRRWVVVLKTPWEKMEWWTCAVTSPWLPVWVAGRVIETLLFPVKLAWAQWLYTHGAWVSDGTVLTWRRLATATWRWLF